MLCILIAPFLVSFLPCCVAFVIIDALVLAFVVFIQKLSVLVELHSFLVVWIFLEEAGYIILFLPCQCLGEPLLLVLFVHLLAHY